MFEIIFTIACIVWFGCGIASYLLWRKYWRQRFNEWTVGERYFAFIGVVFGLFGLIATIMTWRDEMGDQDRWDKPAKW